MFVPIRKGIRAFVATCVHEEMKHFKCDYCNANFEHKCNLNKHVAIVHEERKK